MSREQTEKASVRLGRRAALRAGAALGAVGAGVALGSAAPALAQGGWRTEHAEWEFSPTGVSITLAGGGPPQQGDFFTAWGPIVAVGDVGGAQLGMYHCFGVWTAASTDTSAPYTRLR